MPAKKSKADVAYERLGCRPMVGPFSCRQWNDAVEDAKTGNRAAIITLAGMWRRAIGKNPGVPKSWAVAAHRGLLQNAQ